MRVASLGGESPRRAGTGGTTDGDIGRSFETREKAERAASALREAGFNSNDISVVMRDRSDAAEVATGAGLDDDVSAAGAGAVGGTLLGGAAGLALGLGALAIPARGPSWPSGRSSRP